MEKLSKLLLAECELRGQIQRVNRHLPGGEERSRAKKYGNENVLNTEQGRKCLIDAVIQGKPYMAARFGTSEGNCLYSYWKKQVLGRQMGGIPHGVFMQCA